MHSTRTNASKCDDERRREDNPRPAPTTDRPTETSRRAAPRAPLPSRKSTSQSTRKKNQKKCGSIVVAPCFLWMGTRADWSAHGRVDPIASGGARPKTSARVRTPAPWIEHGILSLRRRAPVSNDARRSKASHSFTSARVGTRLTRYHCAIQARLGRVHRHRDDRRVSTPSTGTHGSERVVPWVSASVMGQNGGFG